VISRRLIASALLVALAAAPWTVSWTSVVAGDRTVAAALVEQGKKALAKKSWTDAVTLFKKALQESPELIEAEYLRAQALEKGGGSKAEAVAAYRSFLEMLEHTPDAAKDVQALKPQAEKRILALAAGESEIQKLDDAFATQLLQFAKKYQSKDKAIAIEAMRLLLATKPDHAEAAELYKSLDGPPLEGAAGAPAAKAAAGAAVDTPFGKLKIKTWHDFIADRAFDAPDVVKYEGEGLVVDLKGGKLVKVTNAPDLGKRYVIDVEFRVIEEKERGWFVGALFGLNADSDMFTAFAQKTTTVVNHGNWKTGPGPDMLSEPMKGGDPGAWRRLGVKVDGATVELWLDGKRAGSAKATDRTDLAGDVGLAQQRCKAEYRVFRAGDYE